MELAALTLAQIDERIIATEARFRASLRRSVYAVANHVLSQSAVTAGQLGWSGLVASTSPDDASLVVQAWHDEVEGKLTPFVATLYYGAADAVNASLGGQVTAPDATDFLTAATNRVKALATELWELIRLALADGLRLGETSGQLAKRVQDIAKLSEARALTIARTEAHAALEAGSLAQLRVSGLEGKKEWRATEDDRTRPSHALADGQSVPLDGKYEVGGALLDYPGDVTGPPGETINCRCTQLFHISTDIDDVVDVAEVVIAATEAETFHLPGLHDQKAHGHRETLSVGDITKILKRLGKARTGDKAYDVVTSTDEFGVVDDKGRNLGPNASGQIGPTTVSGLSHAVGSYQNDAFQLNGRLREGTDRDSWFTERDDQGQGRVVGYGDSVRTLDLAFQQPKAKLKRDVVVERGIINPSAIFGESWHDDESNVGLTWDDPGFTSVTVDGSTAEHFTSAAHTGALTGAPLIMRILVPKDTPTLRIGRADFPSITEKYAWEREVLLPRNSKFRIVADHGVDAKGIRRVDVELVTAGADVYETQVRYVTTLTGSMSWQTVSTVDIPPCVDVGPPIPADHVKRVKVSQDDSMDTVDGDDATLVAAKKPFQESQVKRDTEGKFAKQAGVKVLISKLVASLKGYKKISGQKGSNLGGVYEGPTGHRIYVKRAKSEKHAKNEVLASALYRAAGVDTPQVHRATDAPDLPDTTVGQTYTDLVPGAVPDLSVKLKDPAYRKKLQEGFAVDAWLANWDVAGLTLDNIVTGDDGEPHRIDVGGTLLFRAKGKPKGAEFGDDALEIDTLRDPKINAQAAQLFGDMTDDEIRESVKRVAAITPEAIDQAVVNAGLGKDLADRLKKRRAYLMKRFGVPEPGEKKPAADAMPFTILPKDQRGKSGDGYAAPGLWGRYGAAGVMIRHTDEDGTERFLLVQRGPQVSSNKGKWQLAGGAIDEFETPEQGAAREIHEEIGAPADYVGSMKKVGTHSTAVPIEGKQPWVYSSIAADAPEMFDPVVDQTETGDAKWLTYAEIKELEQSGQLHPALAKNIEAIFDLYDGEPSKSKPVSTPQLESLVESPVKEKAGPTLSGGAKKPKGKPGDPLKITTGVIWPKEPYADGDVIAVSADGSQKLVWDDGQKKYVHTIVGPTKTTSFSYSKKEAYTKLKSQTGWFIPGGEPSLPPQATNAPDLVGQPGDVDVGTTPNWDQIIEGNYAGDYPSGTAVAEAITPSGGKYQLTQSTNTGVFLVSYTTRWYVSQLDSIDLYTYDTGDKLHSELLNYAPEWHAVASPAFSLTELPTPTTSTISEDVIAEGVDWSSVLTGIYEQEYDPTIPIAVTHDGTYRLIINSYASNTITVEKKQLHGTWLSIDDVSLSDDGDIASTQIEQLTFGYGSKWVPWTGEPDVSGGYVENELTIQNWQGLLGGKFSPGTLIATSVDGQWRLVKNSTTYTFEKKNWDGTWSKVSVVGKQEVIKQSKQPWFGQWEVPSTPGQQADYPAPGSVTSPVSVVPVVTPSVVGDTSGISAASKQFMQTLAKEQGAHWYSKPEDIWAAVKKIKQLYPAYSTLQILHALDEGTKTKKSPTPHTDKIHKWLKTNKGAVQSGLSIAQLKEALGQSPTSTAPLTPGAEPPDITTSGIGHLPAATKQEIYAEFKKLPSTSSAKGSPAAIYTAAKQVGSDYNLSLLQVLQVLDEIRAAKVKATGNDAKAYQNNVLAWLKTPKGAAAAAGLPIPKPEKPKLKVPAEIEDFDTTGKYTYDVVSTIDALAASKASKKKYGDWTSEEQAGLTAYTGGIYYSINSYLWGDSDSLSSSNETAMIHIQAGMRPSTRPMLLHRGTGLDGVGGAKSYDQLLAMVGQTYRADGFSSTSVGGKEAFSKTVRLEIEAPPGTPMAYVRPISHFKSENEMTLAAGLHFRIISVKKVGSKIVVRLRVVPEP